MRKGLFSFVVLSLCLSMVTTSCYRKHAGGNVDFLVEYSQRQLDSIHFSTTHHYTNNYNFVVDEDSLMLITQQPEEWVNSMPVDSFAVNREGLVVVSDIRTIPQDTIDSIWVQLATEDSRMGWIHESSLLKQVVPDDPISQFISVFSDIHLLVFLIVIIVILVAYITRKIFTEKAKIVHFNDIDSPYPTALVLLVSSSATFYATIQSFWPDLWQQFYYHPTLNPFAVPHVLGFFLASVWAILIVGIACLDEVYHKMMAGDGVLYLLGLLGICAIDYIVFSISTLYYIGYPLLVAYFWYAIRRTRVKSS